MNEQRARIERAEAALSRAEEAMNHLERAWEQFLAAREDFVLLEQYLNSEERREDLKADEEGRLPAELRRGVLSEDGVWNLLERRDAWIDEARGMTGDSQNAAHIPKES